MARPQTVTDDEILNAARRVISRRGYDLFTLSEVAEEVGLSRGAIILRFKSTQALKVRLAQRMVAHFEVFLSRFSASQSGDGLLDIAAAIGASVANPEDRASFQSVFRGNLSDPELAEIERKRVAMFHVALAARMPKTALSPEAAAVLFEGHLAGAIKQVEIMEDADSQAYVVARTKDWMTLAGITFTKGYDGVVPPRPRAPVCEAPKAKARRAKAKSAAS